MQTHGIVIEVISINSSSSILFPTNKTTRIIKTQTDEDLWLVIRPNVLVRV